MRAGGFSLVEILVALAVMAIGMLALTDYISLMSNQQRLLMQKSEAIAIDTALTNIITSPNQPHCSGNIKAANISFPTGSPPTAPVNVACPTCTVTVFNYYNSAGTIVGPAVPMGPQPDGSGLDVASIQLKNLQYISASEYSGDLYINYGGPPPVPPSAKVASVILMASTSSGTDTLQSCNTSAPCPAGFTLVGTTGTPGAFCISNDNAQAQLFTAVANCAAQNTHLCTANEWLAACDTISGFDYSRQQWVAPIYTGCGSPGCFDTAGGGGGYTCAIGATGGAGFNTTDWYRCCVPEQ